MSINDPSTFIPEQRPWNSFETLADATAELNFLVNGVEVYVISEDAWYYYRESTDSWVPRVATGGTYMPPIPQSDVFGLAASLNLKVNKAGDSLTGNLAFSTGFGINSTGQLLVGASSTDLLLGGANTNIDFLNTSALKISRGTTLQRPTAVNGMFRYNSDNNKFEGYQNSAWINLTDNQTVTLNGDLSGSGSSTINATITNGSVTNAKITSVAWSKITGTPTTISDYGITDAMSTSLTDSYFYIGNSSNIAIGRIISGDATISNTGVLTLETVNSNIGTFNNVTVNAKGLITAASNVSYLTNNQSITISGAASGSGSTSISLTLAVVNSNVGTFNNVTVNNKGLVTAASNISYLTSNENITLSGDISGSGTTTITTIIGDSTVTYAKIQDINTNRLLGRSTSLAGDVEELTIGTGLQLLTGSLSIDSTVVTNTGSQTLTNKTLTSPVINLGSDATGDIYYRNSSGILTRLAVGTSSQFLKGGTIPVYSTIINADLPDSGVTGSTYNNVTVNSKGIITNGSNVSYLTANQTITLSGDIAGSGTTSITTTIGNGAVTNVKINDVAWAKITSTPTTILGYGITDAMSNSLTDSKIFVGNGSNIAAAVLLSGDATLANTGVITLATVNSNVGTFNNFTVNAKGLVTAASNVSYLTANQTITLSGDVTGSGTTAITATIGNSTVTYAKIQNMTTNRLLGRSTASTGNIEELTISTGLQLSTGALSIDSTVATLTGAQTLTNKTLTTPKIDTIRDGSGNNLITFSSNGSANYINISNNSTGNAPRIIAAGSDTNINLSLSSAGADAYVNISNTTGIKISSGTTLQRNATPVNGLLRYNTDNNKIEGYENGGWVNLVSIANTITLTGDVTGSGTTSIATTVANNAITYAKIQNMTTGRLLGRSTAGVGNIEELSVSTGLQLSGSNITIDSTVATLTGIQTLTNKTLTTPVLGVATATSINKVTITAPTTSATLTLIDGSSLITAGAFAITLTSTATTNITLPTSGTLATLAGSENFTNKTGNISQWTNDSGYITSSTASSTYLTINNPIYTGSLTTGTLSFSGSNILASFQSSANNYNQLIMQNTSSGTSASSDFVVANNNGTDTTFYGDFGMNSSGFTGTGSFNLPNAVYLSATSGDLAIGTTTSNAIHFLVNGGSTDALTIGTNSSATFNGVVTIAGASLTTPILYGSSASGGNLQITSTSNGTKGFVYLGTGIGYDDTKNFFGIGTQTPAAQLHMSGNISAAAWTTNGIGLRLAAATYTDTSSSGTVANMYINILGAPTIITSSATTYTTIATLFVDAPVASTNATFTNSPYSIVANGMMRFSSSNGGFTAANNALIQSGSSNSITFQQGGSSRYAIAVTTGNHTFSNATSSSGTTAFMNFTQSAYTGGSAPGLIWTAGAHTGQVASTEVIDWNINTTRTVQFASGALALQRSVVIGSPTYSFVGASTLAEAVSLDIGTPIAGTNATITTVFSARFSGNLKFTGANTTLRFSGNQGFISLDANNGFFIQQAASTKYGISATSNHTFANTTQSSGTTAFVTFTQTAYTGGAYPGLVWTAGAHTGQTASTEITDQDWNNSAILTFATGTIALQRTIRFRARTYAFVGASTITEVVNADFELPTAGTNATFTNVYSARFTGSLKFVGSSGQSQLFFTANSLISLNAGNSYTIQQSGSTKYSISSTSNHTFAGTAQSSGTTAFIQFTQAAYTGGATPGLLWSAAAHTGQTASTEITDINFNLARTITWATGAITTQRSFLIQGATLAFAAASTVTDAVTLEVASPVAGTNATFTKAWAARFIGNVAIGTALYVGSSVVAPTALLHVAANTTTVSAFNITPSAAVDVTSPNNGDIWNNNTDIRIHIVGLALNSVGAGFKIKEGSNATMGVATLIAGTVTVNTNKVTANSRIFLEVQSLGTVSVATPVSITARSAGTSFTISSSNITDTSVVAWHILEPA